MKTRPILWLCVVLPLFMVVRAEVTREKPWEELDFPPLPKIDVPEVARSEFKNGLIVLLLEDREFPLVEIHADIRAGELYDPPEKAGLAAMTAEVMRTGGTEAYPGDDLDVYLESIGARIEFSTETDRATCDLSFLAEHTDDLLLRFADMLMNPAFPQQKIELAKVGERTAIAARNDELFDIARREYRKVVYGAESPYARHTEYATIEGITQDDLKLFHENFYRPDGMVITITGDFKKNDMKKRIERFLGGWAAPANPIPEPPPVPEIQPRGIYYAPKTDVTQSTILLGHKGFRADDPDFAAMRLLNEILGGGFSSRITNEVRTKRGLAYMANSIPGYAYPRPGIFGAIAGTKSESTLVAVKLLEQEIQRVTEEPVTDLELERARSALLNSFVFNFDSRRKIANRIGMYEFYGYPLDFLNTYQEGLQDATPQTILEAAQRKIHPENLSVLVIGNKDEFAGSLAELGEIVEVDISIPEPPSVLQIPEPTDETRARAKALLKQAVDLEGGLKAMASLRSLKMEMDAKITMQGMSFDISSTEIRIFPDRVYSSQLLPFGQGTAVQVVNGDTGWTKDPRGLMDMSEEQIAEAQAEKERNRLNVLTTFSQLEMQALDPVEVDGETCDRVYVRSDHVKDWMLYFNPDGRLVRMDYQGKGPTGPVEASVRYTAFTEAEGIGFPSALETLHDGEPFLTATLTNIEVNPDVDIAIFEKPTE